MLSKSFHSRGMPPCFQNHFILGACPHVLKVLHSRGMPPMFSKSPRPRSTPLYFSTFIPRGTPPYFYDHSTQGACPHILKFIRSRGMPLHLFKVIISKGHAPIVDTPFWS